MRKRVYGRRLSRDTNERKALFRSLATALITYGRIDTTEAKAKAVRPWVEKLVTRARFAKEHDKRLLLADIPNEKVIDRLVTAVAPVFSDRPGGYTRITRLGPRAGDNAPVVRLEFVEEIKEPKKATSKKTIVKARTKLASKTEKKTKVKIVSKAKTAKKVTKK
jgi:large subunit ribosomal protein L17